MVIKGQQDIEVYISVQGYLCLKQHNPFEGDAIITIAPAFANKVAAALISMQPQAAETFEKTGPDEPPEPG